MIQQTKDIFETYSETFAKNILWYLQCQHQTVVVLRYLITANGNHADNEAWLELFYLKEKKENISLAQLNESNFYRNRK